MALIDLIAKYQTLLATKEALAEQTKANNKAIEDMKQRITDQMIDDEVTSIGYAGYNFSLQTKTVYSKKSEADLQAAGINFFGLLRENGLGDLIVERVDPRTLSASLKQIVEAEGDLPEDIREAINVYETNDIGRRKQAKRFS
jgi:hypothetical protein